MENTHPRRHGKIWVTEEDEVGFLLPGNTGRHDDPYS
jgi:hypothetical protein